MNDGANFDDIIQKLKTLSNPDAVEGMAIWAVHQHFIETS